MENKNPKRVVIKEELVELTGNFTLAITLNQLLYWSLRVRDKDKFIHEEVSYNSTNTERNMQYGWIYKTSEELSQEIMIGSQTTVRRYLKDLVASEFIFERRNPNPKYKYDKTFQYRVNLNKIKKDLNSKGYKLDHFEDYYNENEVVKVTEQRIDRSINQYESSNTQLAYSMKHNEAAIPEITSENTLKNINNKEAVRNNKDLIKGEEVKEITQYYLEKSGKPFLTVKEKEAVTQIVELELPYLKVKELIDKCYEDFKMNSSNKSIHSFKYVANYIFQHYKSQETKSKIKNTQEEKLDGENKQSAYRGRGESAGEEWLKLIRRKRDGGNNDSGIR